MSKLVIQEGQPREAVGVQDGPHHILSCSNCRKKLVDIWVTRPHENSQWNMYAKCCYCNDRSMYTKVNGGFTYYGIENQTDILDVDIDETQNIVMFKTGKAKNDSV
jgi:DNA-directed RNA polymerase subunit RPC12/RpoP